MEVRTKDKWKFIFSEVKHNIIIVSQRNQTEKNINKSRDRVDVI